MEIPRRPEDTLSPAARAAHARAPSVATGKADRQRVIRHAEVPAWVAAERMAAVAEQRTEVAAGITNQGFVVFLVAYKGWKWREAICGERS